jgi:hypothetical protein
MQQVYSEQFNSYIDSNDVKNVDRMLEEGKVVPNSENIESAIENNHTEIVRLLLEDGRAAPYDDSFETAIPLGISGRVRDPEIVRLLLEDGRVEPRTAYMYVAAYEGNVEIVRLLLKDGRANPSQYFRQNYKYSPLYAVVRNESNERFYQTRAPNIRDNHKKILRMLLEDPRVDPTIDDHIILQTASDQDTIEILLEYYANNNINISEFIELLEPENRKYILLYYDIDDIPVYTFDFGLDGNNLNDERFVDSMLARLAYNTEKREKFLRLINPIGYNLEGAGVGIRGVRNIISEYADINTEMKTNYEITQTLDEIGIPKPLIQMIGKFSM